MKVEINELAPYFLFGFGLIITYIGWTTRKILQNIEEAIKITSLKVDSHEHDISNLFSTLKIHDYKIQNLKSEVVEIKNGVKILYESKD